MTREDWLSIGPPGWQPLLEELDSRLKQRWPEYTISQVKEKFGTLRFYAHHGVDTPDFPDTDTGQAEFASWYAENTEAFQALVYEYEERSAHVCELCGQPGKLGDRAGWWATRCPECAPDGWVAEDNQCRHDRITGGTCDECGRIRIARLEHTDVVLYNTHQNGSCMGEYCTLHNRSSHPLRALPQHWRADRQIMERVCEHGAGHPDPDEINGDGVHGCDGCCTLDPK